MPDDPQPRYRRILLKLSGEALQGEGYGIDTRVLGAVAEQIVEVGKLGVQVGVVIGAGNIFRGVRAAAEGMNRTNADAMGMLGTVINSMAMQDALQRRGAAARVLSAISMERICDTYTQRRAMLHLEEGEIVVLAAGTGNPYFTTDTAAVLRALEIEADIVLKATKVDGIYDKDPVKHADARRFVALDYKEVLSRDLQVMDATAISLCKDNNLPLAVFNMRQSGNIRRVVLGEQIGTVVQNTLGVAEYYA
jgi:uridylate kinase